MAQKVCDTQRALKSVADALQLDSENFDKDAYVKYLESISIIASSLRFDQQLELNDARHLSTQQRQKLIDVARQCLDRVDVLSKKLETVKNGNISPTNKSIPDNSSELMAISDETIGLPVSHQDENRARKNKITSMPPLEFVNYTMHPTNVSILETIDWVSPESSFEESSTSRIKRISPLERTYRENKTLIALYKKRSLRAPNPQVRINLSLELQRRLSENLQVGHTQQEIYLRQLREQQEKQLNEITKKVLSLEEISSKALTHRRELCAKVIEYERSQNGIENSKKQLCLNPNDADLAEAIVRHILRDSKHPISKEMKLRSEQLIDKIKPLIDANSLSMAASPPQKDVPKSAHSLLSPEKAHHSSESSADSDSEITDPDREVCLSNLPQTARTLAEDDCDKSDNFKEVYSHSVEDVELAIKAGNTAMSSLKSTLKKQKSVLKKNPIIYFKKTQTKEEPGNSSRAKSKKKKSQIKKMELEAIQRHLENIAGDVREASDELSELLELTCEPLEHEENHGRCHAVVEEFFFPIFWPMLMQLSKLAYVQDEKHVAETMEKLQDCTPIMLGFDADSSNVQPAREEYDKAVLLLKQITELQTPTKKLETLVLVAKTLCQKQSQSQEDTDSPRKMKPIGADDLIPLLSYVCIQSRISELILECNLLEHLILQKYLMGEAGYCLTSLQTALQYIQTFELRNSQGKHPETAV